MSRRKLSSEINVVPYIDVMLVLLIIFMVTAPLLVQGIQVDLPEVDAQSMGEPDEDVVLSIAPGGEMMISGLGPEEGPLSDAQVSEKIGALVRARPEKMIMIHGDGRAPYQHVAHAMGLLQAVGAKKVGFVTQPAEPPAAKAGKAAAGP